MQRNINFNCFQDTRYVKVQKAEPTVFLEYKQLILLNLIIIIENTWSNKILQRQKSETTCTLEPRSLKMISTSKILPNCCKETKQGNAEWLMVFKSCPKCHQFNRTLKPNHFSLSFIFSQMSYKNQPGMSQISEMPGMSGIVVLTPNICLRSGSLNLKGMLETWSLLGWALLSVLSGTVCVGGWLSVWSASSVCWKTQNKGHMCKLDKICYILEHKTVCLTTKASAHVLYWVTALRTEGLSPARQLGASPQPTPSHWESPFQFPDRAYLICIWHY